MNQTDTTVFCYHPFGVLQKLGQLRYQPGQSDTIALHPSLSLPNNIVLRQTVIAYLRQQRDFRVTRNWGVLPFDICVSRKDLKHYNPYQDPLTFTTPANLPAFRQIS